MLFDSVLAPRHAASRCDVMCRFDADTSIDDDDDGSSDDSDRRQLVVSRKTHVTGFEMLPQPSAITVTVTVARNIIDDDSCMGMDHHLDDVFCSNMSSRFPKQRCHLVALDG